MPKQLYQCEICKAIYATSAQAATCEKAHLSPDKQELFYGKDDVKKKYPISIKLWFGAQCCEYTRQIK